MAGGAPAPKLRGLLVAGVAVGALLLLLYSTGPRPTDEYSGVVWRFGGPCLELERWDLFGWNVVGQTLSIDDTRTGTWHSPVADPSCSAVMDQEILVRLPLDAPEDVYRLCGLADDRACIEFRRVAFEGTPGP